LGFPVSLAIRFLSLSKVWRNTVLFGLNRVFLSCGCRESRSIILSLIGNTRAKQFFSGWLIATVLRLKSMSCHSILASSPSLAAVSLAIWSSVAVLGLAVPINRSNSVSGGMYGITSSVL